MAVTFNWYDVATQNAADGTWESTGALGTASIALKTQPLTLMLATSSYTFSAGHTTYANVSGNEIANGNGYSTGGLAMSSLNLVQAAPLSNFTAANTVWTASGGSIAAWQFAICYINATVGGIVKPLLFAINAGAVQGPTTTGNTTGVNWNATAVFQITHS